MFCKYCGNQIHERAIFCSGCNTFFNSEANAAPLIAQPAVNAVQTQKKFNGWSLAGIIISILSLITGCIFVKIYIAQYVGGVELQYYCSIPLIIGTVFSLVGTIRAKKLKSGLGLGIAGLAVGIGAFVISALYYVFMVMQYYTSAAMFFILLLLL
ncbi:MAG: hypothetical protein K2N22_00745 [Clostridia bacterium]|nr:hypothetical protein [Clostridia bacterium]